MKGHNQEEQKKPNTQQGAKTLNKKQQDKDKNTGRRAVNPTANKGSNSVK